MIVYVERKIVVNMNSNCSVCRRPGVLEVDGKPGKLCSRCLLKRLDQLFKAAEEEERKNENDKPTRAESG